MHIFFGLSIYLFGLCLRLRGCVGFSLAAVCGRLLLQGVGPRHAGLSSYSPQAQWLQCTGSVACGIFPDQGLNPRLQHWQVDSLPFSHQGIPNVWFRK